MARIQFNIPEIFERTFGVRYDKPDVVEPSSDISSDSITGAPVPESLIIGGLKLPNEIQYDISSSRNIVETPVQGRDGMVKELISNGDPIINIRGLIINYGTEDYPQDQVRELRELIARKESLQIENRVLNDVMEIFEVVVYDHSFPMMTGHPNVQPFALSLRADTPIELEVEV